MYADMGKDRWLDRALPNNIDLKSKLKLVSVVKDTPYLPGIIDVPYIGCCAVLFIRSQTGILISVNNRLAHTLRVCRSGILAQSDTTSVRRWCTIYNRSQYSFFVKVIHCGANHVTMEYEPTWRSVRAKT